MIGCVRVFSSLERKPSLLASLTHLVRDRESVSSKGVTLPDQMDRAFLYKRLFELALLLC